MIISLLGAIFVAATARVRGVNAKHNYTRVELTSVRVCKSGCVNIDTVCHLSVRGVMTRRPELPRYS